MDGIKLFSRKRKREYAVKRDQGTAQPVSGNKAAEQAAKLQNLTAAGPDGRPSDRPDAEASELCGFHDLGVSEWLELVCNSLGMKQPTQVGLWLTEHAVDLLQPLVVFCAMLLRRLAGCRQAGTAVDPMMCTRAPGQLSAALAACCGILWQQAGTAME